ncbi:hypothetical protein BBBOND_0402880 [Babesia bigemina]|uniref:Uncharacterized protein n=1 Tax=Babesia bigemina TaxID=5866 RepID=A0A061DES7_BABBI|nr:hypothetical protein BBBOND_0402880 [Babesia bigemina]CDR97800.1 hypothetical protein BBBOND_0402880 [Babesia bigemina]|eukprot:XP_012769986.1 hypothetical protein BBBOND_0402880 [Babesia bigemina]
MDEITKFKNIEVIYHRAAQLQSPLKKIAEAILKSEDPPEKKAALQNLCNEFSNGLEGIINATKDYAERGRMLREARQIIIELKSGSPTIMRSNELNKAMKLLDQSFECKHRLLSDIHQNDVFEYVFRLLDIEQFVNTHKVPEPSAKEGEIMAGKVNDAPNDKPPFYYGNAPDRKRTDGQSLSDTLNIIRADLNKIDVILRDPLMEDKGSVDAVNNILSYFHKFEVKAPDFVKFVSQCLDKFSEETHLFKKRDTIINRLNALDVNSDKAIPYLQWYKEVESQIYELLTLKEIIVLEDLQREVSQVLHKLPHNHHYLYHENHDNNHHFLYHENHKNNHHYLNHENHKNNHHYLYNNRHSNQSKHVYQHWMRRHVNRLNKKAAVVL